MTNSDLLKIWHGSFRFFFRSALICRVRRLFSPLCQNVSRNYFNFGMRCKMSEMTQKYWELLDALTMIRSDPYSTTWRQTHEAEDLNDLVCLECTRPLAGQLDSPVWANQRLYSSRWVSWQNYPWIVSLIPAVETAVVMTNGLEDNKQEYGTGCVLESMFTMGQNEFCMCVKVRIVWRGLLVLFGYIFNPCLMGLKCLFLSWFFLLMDFLLKVQ